MRLWNIHGDLKHTSAPLEEWITCAKFGMTDDTSPVISAGYDRIVRIWDRSTFNQKYGLVGHTGYINSIAIAPDSTLVASGGQDKIVNIWDVNTGKFMYPLNAGAVINHIDFSPNKFWIATATDNSVKIFDLGKKACLAEIKLQPEDLGLVVGESKSEPKMPKAISCAFSPDGSHIFVGYSDAYIRVWSIPAVTGSASA